MIPKLWSLVGALTYVCYNAGMTFIVDGHNLIGQMIDLSLDDPEDEGKLVGRLRRYHARTGRKIVVVFDSGSAFQLLTKQTVGAVEVVCAGTGTTADEVIVQRVQRVENPRNVTVVTSDREVRTAVIRVGASVVGADAFVKEMGQGSRRRSPRKKRRTATSDPTAMPLPDGEVREWLRIFGQPGPDTPHG